MVPRADGAVHAPERGFPWSELAQREARFEYNRPVVSLRPRAVRAASRSRRRGIGILALIALGTATWLLVARSPDLAGENRPGAPKPAASAGGRNDTAVFSPGDDRSTGHRTRTRLPTAVPENPAPGPLPAWLVDVIDPGAGEIVTNRDPALGGGGLNPRDLAALQAIIDLNGLEETTSAFDVDDGDGAFEPWELGFQVWQLGSLVALSFGPDPYWSFGYDVTVLPAEIGDLQQLRYLDLHGNHLRELPEEIGDLGQLQKLILGRNRLVGLPPTVAYLDELRGLSLSENSLSSLPEEIGNLDRLEHLHVADNPIEELPGTLGQLRELRMLEVSHEIGARSDPATDASDPETGGGLEQLPRTLASLDDLEILHVTGNRLCGRHGAGAGIPSGTRVFGLSAQDCNRTGP